jgi:hypothetical protein
MFEETMDTPTITEPANIATNATWKEVVIWEAAMKLHA